ncbi:MAG: hypothetical protein IIZ06_09560 [Kiritimatiellae bacterium]|nr:hypothetical protein [Kiritimatiellia bacterium]
MTSTNTIVANAIKAQAVRNSVEVEISPGYAARVQHAMRDAARAVSGVRMTSTNTLECRDEDAADDVIDILKQAGLPDGEVWTNARRAANAAYKLSSTEAKVGDRVKVVGALGTYVVTKVDGEWIEIKDADDGTPQGRVEARFATPVKNAKRATNAIGDLDFDMKGVYETAKKMLAAGSTHKGGYHWSVPKTYATGAGVVASRVGGAVKVVRDDPDRAGFVIAEITDPLAQALERKGVPNACGTARNAEASQKLRNAWHSAFDALKGLYAAAQAERHSAIADAANKAVKTLMDNTKDLGIS